MIPILYNPGLPAGVSFAGEGLLLFLSVRLFSSAKRMLV
jgi:hypothetical protein